MAELVEAAVVNEARRLATVRRVRQLLPGEVAVFDGLCRLATGLLRADAAVIAEVLPATSGEVSQLILRWREPASPEPVAP